MHYDNLNIFIASLGFFVCAIRTTIYHVIITNFLATFHVLQY